MFRKCLLSTYYNDDIVTKTVIISLDPGEEQRHSVSVQYDRSWDGSILNIEVMNQGFLSQLEMRRIRKLFGDVKPHVTPGE